MDSFGKQNDIAQKEMIVRIFNEFAEAFKAKITKDYYISLQYEIEGSNGKTAIQVHVKDGNVRVSEDLENDVEDTLVMSYDTLLKLYSHELNYMTAMSCLSKESDYKKTFIEPRARDEKRIIFLDKENDAEAVLFAKRMHKMDDFFNKDKEDIVKVESRLCGKAHGVNAIALFSDYEKGILHAYFEIEKGEELKEPAIPFSIFILQGSGLLFIEDEKYEIEENTYYKFEPSGGIRVINESSVKLKLLYIAG
ncbi:MAG: cupin domain-containing protein [Butyrivibrio sp.]|uniref:hypothetical protein n=1 Tax=Butyrivibrio sp. TaxID=28121 RepID=UPI001EC43EAF|nr:hypothetical protein [Butyrivibrio sp.]MBE5842079.1 cupin domain-containing protein [Butyrivibrio sp.]